MASLYRSVTAWRQSLEAVLALGRQLADPDWAAPTECPRWTVKDVFSHLVGGERWMGEGHPLPEEGYQAWAAGPVLARRESPPATVLAELREAYERRRVQVARERIDPELPAHLPTGTPAPLGRLLQWRALDVWVHEQDIRRATGRPGNLASPAAAVAAEIFLAALPRIVAKSAQTPPGSTVRLSTTGELALDVAVTVDRSGRGALVAPGRPAMVQLQLSWEAYARLSCGRGSRADHEIRITGDRPVAERVLNQLALTP